MIKSKQNITKIEEVLISAFHHICTTTTKLLKLHQQCQTHAIWWILAHAFQMSTRLANLYPCSLRLHLVNSDLTAPILIKSSSISIYKWFLQSFIGKNINYCRRVHIPFMLAGRETKTQPTPPAGSTTSPQNLIRYCVLKNCQLGQASDSALRSAVRNLGHHGAPSNGIFSVIAFLRT